MTFQELDKIETDALIAEEAAKKKEKLNAQKADAQDVFDRLTALRNNEDFKWFVAQYLEPMRQKQHDAALDIANSPEARNNHAQQHHRTNEMLSVLESEHRRLHEFIIQ